MGIVIETGCDELDRKLNNHICYGGGGKSDGPDPPDYAAAAREQGRANLEATRAGSKLSNPNYITPYGERRVTYGTDGTFDEAAYNRAVVNYQQNLRNWQNNTNRGFQRTPSGKPTPGGFRGPAPVAPNRDDFFIGGDPDVATVVETLSPETQALYDQQLRISGALGDLSEENLGRLADVYSQDFDFTSATDARDKAEAALMDRLNPYLDRDLENKRTELLQAGIQPGTEAWKREMDDFNRRSNDARLGIIANAGAEQDRALQTAAFLRNLPLNEVNALRTGVQIQSPSFPGFSGSNVQAPDIIGATNAQYNAELGQANAQNAASAGLYSGLVGLAGAGLQSPWLGGVFGF